MRRIFLSVILTVLPLSAVVPSSLHPQTVSPQSSAAFPAGTFGSTSSYNTGTSASFASSASERMVGTTTLPAPAVSAPYDDYDDWEDEYGVSGMYAPRRSPGEGHSGGTSVDTPGAKLGDVVVPMLLMSVIYVLIRTGKKVRRYIVNCGKAFARMWHEALAAIVRGNKDWY